TPYESVANLLSAHPNSASILLLKQRIEKLAFFLPTDATKEEEVEEEEEDEEEDDEEEDDDEDLFGLFNGSNGTHPDSITVFPSIHESPQHVFSTVLHEFGHLVQDAIFGVGNNRESRWDVKDDAVLTDALRDKGLTQGQLDDHGPIFCSVMWKIHLLVGCFVGGGFRDLYLHDELQGIRPTEEYLKRFSLTPPLPHVSGSAASSQSHHMDLESDDYAL
ncbi:hypothetical protein AAVH_38804, partial [Aphelenchoides avenae]